MNKFITKLGKIFLGLSMAAGVGVAVSAGRKDINPVEAAEATVSGNFEKITSSSELTEGDYLLVANYTIKGTTYNRGLRSVVSSNKLTSLDVTISSNTISNPVESLVWHLSSYVVDNNTYWRMYNASTEKYVYATGTKSQAILGDDGTDNKALFTPTMNSTSKKWAMVSKYNTSQSVNAYFRNQNDATLSSATWACYAASDGNNAILYKKAAISVTGVSVYPTSCGLVVGGTQQLTPTVNPSNATNKNVSYSSSANGVATVSSTGLITAVSAGNATITVTTADGGYTDTCTVTVTAAAVAVTGVSLNKASTSIEAPNTETLTATVAPENATNKSVIWTSGTPAVATVSSSGVVTGVSKGTAVITVTTADGGFTASCTVTVTAPSSVAFTGGTDTGEAGGQGESDSLTKSGVTMACDSCYTTSGAYRFYSGSTLTISSTVGNIAQIQFNMNGSYNSGLLSTSTGTYNSNDSTKGIWTGDAASIAFDLSAQARVNSIVITLASNDPTVELDATSATEVSMMKGDTDTSVKVLVKNIDSLTWSFTFDEEDDEELSTSSYISVTASALVSNVSTLTITTKAVGSTTMHICVSGTACETTIPVTVTAKPASMTIVHSDIVAGELEIITGAYKQVSFSGEDTDGNAYAIAA